MAFRTTVHSMLHGANAIVENDPWQHADATGQPKMSIRGAADRFTMHPAGLEIEKPSWRFSLDAHLCVEPTRRHQTRLCNLDPSK